MKTATRERRQEFVEIVYSRLQSLGPGEWLQAGPLFEEIRLKIPFAQAMRLAITRNADGKIPNGDKAQWLFFCQQMGHMNVEFSSDGRWREHTDRIRLRSVATCACGGPVTKLRARRSRGICMACREEMVLKPDKRTYHGRGRARVPPPMVTPEPQPPPKRPFVRNGFKSEIPIGRGQFITLQASSRRRAAMAIRNLLPMGRSVSINYIVSELERQHDDISAVLRRYGINDHRQLVMLINNRYMLEQLGLAR